MKMTKEIYDKKMNEYELNTYEELEAFRWTYSDNFDNFLQSLSLTCSSDELDEWKVNCSKMQHEYDVIVEMVYFGFKESLFE